MQWPQFVETLNTWGNQQIPFLFLVDFEMQKPQVFRMQDVPVDKIWFDIHGVTNVPKKPAVPILPFDKQPLSAPVYQQKFENVYKRLSLGDTYLTNLTVKTPIALQQSLEDLFYGSQARYKVLVRDEFLVFSPEIFIQIRDGRIYTYPMKGTIDATVPDARNKILADQKELAEHITIVDLLRNDLSLVADHVSVTKFRYTEEIRTTHKNLLQVSSEIGGQLPADYRSRLGDILTKLLPAGSVSGAPKRKTLEIIRQAEGEPRGYYTGVVGYFDGSTLDCGVMIRYIEKQKDQYCFRSGGGITAQSVWQEEYQEVINKVYVPVD